MERWASDTCVTVRSEECAGTEKAERATVSWKAFKTPAAEQESGKGAEWLGAEVGRRGSGGTRDWWRPL